jgi:hypothetical protein
MKNFLIALSVVLLFGACNAQAPISRENACWFLFDQTYHPTSFLFVAVQVQAALPMSPPMAMESRQHAMW